MKMTVASPTPFPDVDEGDREDGQAGVGEPAWSVDADPGEGGVDQSGLGVHQNGEGQPDTDGADQGGEEDDRVEVAAGDDLGGEDQGQDEGGSP